MGHSADMPDLQKYRAAFAMNFIGHQTPALPLGFRSAPCTWNTLFAKSKPIVLTSPIDASLKWCSSTPPLWHTKIL
jgi:formylmethanofuran dehydrogenase subunit E